MEFQDFGWALRKLKMGIGITKVRRTGWRGKGLYISIKAPDKDALPFIYMYTAGGKTVPYIASYTDMLAADWEISE